ncbi:MAG: glycosyltransferase [Pseudomonadota bacterium]|nr:glycosyltransferase [Pseudomonadota bacterium]
MRLSLVIPCYNEAKTLPLLAERCAALLAVEPASEVILVDNGSSDDTPIVMATLLEKTPGLRGLRVPYNQGYGHGILSGLAAATGDILGWTHADMQTDPLDASRGMALFRQSPEPQRLFCKGRRFGRPLWDTFFTAGMSAFDSLLLRCALNDINAQPNLFHRSFFESWSEAPPDFSLDLFAYYMAKRQNLHVQRFPVAFVARAFGNSHWNVDWRSKMKFIRRTVEFSLKLRATRRLRS